MLWKVIFEDTVVPHQILKTGKGLFCGPHFWPAHTRSWSLECPPHLVHIKIYVHNIINHWLLKVGWTFKISGSAKIRVFSWPVFLQTTMMFSSNIINYSWFLQNAYLYVSHYKKWSMQNSSHGMNTFCEIRGTDTHFFYKNGKFFWASVFFTFSQ